MTISVVIADDHQILLQGLASLLDAAAGIELLGQASDGDQCAELVREHQPDVAVCDVSMPTFGAEELARLIARENWTTEIVALTVHEDVEVVRAVLDSGVQGYVLKKNAFDELSNAIDAVAGGLRFVSPTIAGTLFDAADKSVPLSAREREVLKGIGEGLAYKQIASKLDISVRTVETYRVRLMNKLELQTTSDLIRFANRRSY